MENSAEQESPVLPAPVTEEAIASVTHPGLGRSSNEDNLAVAVKNGYALLIVADGIGGHEYGDVASRLCVTELMQKWCELSSHIAMPSAEDIRAYFVREIAAVNAALYEKNQQRQLIHPMGTTLVCAIMTPEALFCAHLGDSRLYRLRNGELTQITHDHSYISDLVSNRIISEYAARNHPYAHVINHSLGVTEHVDPEINVIARRPHERYLICSDGAYLHADTDELEALLYDADSPRDACDHILKTALDGGGEDNITAIVMFA